MHSPRVRSVTGSRHMGICGVGLAQRVGLSAASHPSGEVGAGVPSRVGAALAPRLRAGGQILQSAEAFRSKGQGLRCPALVFLAGFFPNCPEIRDSLSARFRPSKPLNRSNMCCSSVTFRPSGPFRRETRKNQGSPANRASQEAKGRSAIAERPFLFDAHSPSYFVATWRRPGVGW